MSKEKVLREAQTQYCNPENIQMYLLAWIVSLLIRIAEGIERTQA